MFKWLIDPLYLTAGRRGQGIQYAYSRGPEEYKHIHEGCSPVPSGRRGGWLPACCRLGDRSVFRDSIVTFRENGHVSVIEDPGQPAHPRILI